MIMKSQMENDLFTDIGDNVARLQTMIQDWAIGKKRLRAEHQIEYEEYEEKMLAFLWRCRGLLSTAKLARMIGISRQRLYELWEKHGYVVDDTSKD